MRSGDIEPLEPGLWMQRIEQLGRWSVADERDVERTLRHAFHLVQLAPRPLRHLIHCACSEREFETLLGAGAFDAAALRLVGHRTPFLLNRTAGNAGATVQIGWDTVPAADEATAPSVAPAVMRAWIEWIVGFGHSQDQAPGLSGDTRTADHLATQH